MGDESDNAPVHDDVYVRYLELHEHHKKWIKQIKEGERHGKRGTPFADSLLLEHASALVGGLPLVKQQGIVLPPGRNVPTHPHEGTSVVLYMPMDHPSELHFQNPDLIFPTIAGSMVLIPAGRWHSVTLNETLETRYTIGAIFRG